MLENKVRYSDWATAWTQHWWTGGPDDRPATIPFCPAWKSNRVSVGRPAPYIIRWRMRWATYWIDYGGGLGRRPENKPFEPGNFGTSAGPCPGTWT